MRNKNLQRIIICSVLTLWSICITAQNPISTSLPNYTPMSPEAAAVVRAVNYPVNYYTGLVPVNIPLFEIKSGDIILPISLNYHASGLKVKEENGWAGLGWTLSAEPSISRRVNGIPDDENGTRTGFWFHNVGNTAYYNSYSYLKDVLNGLYDEEPDDFYYSLIGKSGRFRFNKPTMGGDYIFTIPYDPIFIDFTSVDFDIIDENGFEYSFGGDDQYRERSDMPGSPKTVTRWMAKKVRSVKTGATIDFSYHNVLSRNIDWSCNDKITVEDRKGSYAVVRSTTNTGTHVYHVNDRGEVIDDWVESEISTGQSFTVYEKRISEISFINGKIRFSTDNQRFMKKMTVTDDHHNLIREIEFFISPYNQIVGNSRTKMDSLIIKDGAGKVVEKYSFSYHNPGGVPLLSSNAYDHWGYYNGPGNNTDRTSGVPAMDIKLEIMNSNGIYTTTNFTVGEANRESNPVHMKYGMLENILHSSGTKTTFDYSGNKYWWEDSESERNTYVGGLHVSQIRVEDLVNRKFERKIMVYGKHSTMPMVNDCGILKQKVTLDSYVYTQEKEVRTHQPPMGYSGDKSRVRTILSTPITDVFFSNGAPMIYDYANEWLFDPDKEERLKTVYSYTKDPSYYIPEPYPEPFNYPAPFDTKLSEDWRYGSLEGTVQYKYHETPYECGPYDSPETCEAVKEMHYRYIPVQEKTIQQKVFSSYGIIYPRKIYQRKILVGDEFFYESEKLDAIGIFDNQVKSGWVRPERETVTQYLDSRERMLTTKEYTYGPYTHPEKIVTTTGTDIKEEYFTYTDNFPYIELLEYREKHGEEQETTQMEYLSFKTPSVVKTNTGTDKSMEPRIRYHSYDESRNPTCVSYDRGSVTAYVWGYKKQYLVAKIESTSGDANFYNLVCSLIGAENMAVLDGNPTDIQVRDIFDALRSHTRMKNAMVSSYTHRPLIGVTSETDPSGRTVFYEYDHSGRLQRVMDEDKNILKEHRYNYNRRYRR